MRTDYLFAPIAIVFAMLAGALVPIGPAAAQAETPWSERQTGYLPARDGTELKYSVLLPKGRGPFPVIMNYSGYDPGSIGGIAYQAGNTTMSPAIDAQLLAAGYAVVGVNMAGTACSAGSFRLMAGRWSRDGYDAVEWAAAQPWSNGRVGMANWSFAGLSQIMTATERPPHLRAIAPGMAVSDPWRDVGFPGGVKNHLFPATWSLFIQSRWASAASTAAAEGDSECIANLAANNASFPKVSPRVDQETNPYPADGGLEGRQVWKRVRQIKVPMLSMVSWQDEATGPRNSHLHDMTDPRRTYLVGSNGVHNNYVSERYRKIMLRFFDRFVKGRRNGFEKEPRVRLWLDATAPDLPGLVERETKLRPGTVIKRRHLPVKVRPMRLNLRAKGRLTARPPGAREGHDAYAYPDRGPAVNAYLGSDDERWEAGRVSKEGTAAFTTAPLARTLTFQGSASLNIWVSSTAPDADIQATISEVRPDGREVYVQRGWLRLSERALDPKLSTALVPWQRRERGAISPLKNAKPVHARMEILSFAHIFRRGSSIRVILDTPSTTGGWDFTSPADPSTIRIFHDRRRPSRLVMGLLQRGGIKSGRPACGSLMMQPCRSNTLPVPGAHP